MRLQKERILSVVVGGSRCFGNFILRTKYQYFDFFFFLHLETLKEYNISVSLYLYIIEMIQKIEEINSNASSQSWGVFKPGPKNIWENVWSLEMERLVLNFSFARKACIYLIKRVKWVIMWNAVQTCLNIITGCATLCSNNCYQVFAINIWQWVFHIAVEQFCPTLPFRIVLILQHWRVFKHEWTV